MKKRIYCDYNATTPVIPAVKKAYINALDVYGNASSLHETGRMAKEALENSRMAVAAFINALPEQLLFCSSGTEANNQVLQQLIAQQRDEGPVHVLVSAIEHSSVLETAKILESWGIEVECIPVTAEGLVEVDTLVSLLKPHTKLVSVMFANNEIGSIQDIAALSRVVKDHGALFHCDAVQALGKVVIDVAQLDVDFMTFSAHKIGAPKGVSRLIQRVGRSNHRIDQPSRAILVPTNRFEYLECLAAKLEIESGSMDGANFRVGGLDVLAQHLLCKEVYKAGYTNILGSQTL